MSQTITRHCSRCMTRHPIHYTIGLSCHHLVLECPRGEYFIEFEPGLLIRTVESKKLVRVKNVLKQPEFL